jgi:hypothetical protein
MFKKPLLLSAGFVAALALCSHGLLAQSAGSSSAPPPPPPLPAGQTSTTSTGPKVDLSKLPPVSDKTGLTYATDIQPMLKASCSTCHGDTKPRSGYSVMTATSVLKDAKGKAIIVPGHSDKSTIVLYVSGLVARKEMPPLNARDKNPPLTKEQIGVLRAWIDQGAK